MIKNKPEFLIGLIVFVLVLIIKFSGTRGAGALMALGLIVTVIISSIK